MDTQVPIRRLKIISFFLFLIPTIGLIGSLIFHNILISINFNSEKLVLNDVNPNFQIECNKDNNYCALTLYTLTVKSLDEIFPEKVPFELSKCNNYFINSTIMVDGKILSKTKYMKSYFLTTNGLPYSDKDIFEFSEDSGNLDKTALFQKDLFKKKFPNRKIFQQFYLTDKKNRFCIKNSSLYKFHKMFPTILNSINHIKKNDYKPGTNRIINPFIYGETSISNIVKRYPVNLLFKPVMFLTSLIMLFYWLQSNKLLKNLLTRDDNYWFLYLGLFSSLCLLFHVFFLGSEITNEIFNKFKKIILLLFIIFEISAQILLTRKLYLMRDMLNKHIRKRILQLKIIYSIMIFFISLGILTILIFTGGFTSKIDYLIEWNYFMFLLLFYFLSFFIWKKNN